ncbi:MAG: hypothetical protein ACYC61_00260 [Isosphaeraceae bacterium]
MSNCPCSPSGRRAFLRVGTVAGVALIMGCEESGPKKVDSPPIEKGNRSRLDRLKEKTPPAKK